MHFCAVAVSLIAARSKLNLARASRLEKGLGTTFPASQSVRSAGPGVGEAASGGADELPVILAVGMEDDFEPPVGAGLLLRDVGGR